MVDVYVDGAKCADLCRMRGMSENENAKLKKLLAEQMLHMAAMKELLSGSRPGFFVRGLPKADKRFPAIGSEV